ncbi:NUDIX hydrolase [Candidatus Microgenomates bacterium]|nr:NUDIX hydrolase [Candidatus Microgenomates bacterium]
MTPDATYYQSLPKKRMAAAALFVNDKNEVLLVKPTYKTHWEIPGGVVEENESPRNAVIREVKEELGLTLTNPEFLCIDYAIASGPKDESLQFVFFGGNLDQKTESKIKLQQKELSEYKFVQLAKAKALTINREVHTSFPDRIEQALRALQKRKAVYLEDGKI